MKKMKVTIKDLAEKAGVSKTAVSFAFNNPKRISQETYKKIMKIAKKLDIHLIQLQEFWLQNKQAQ